MEKFKFKKKYGQNFLENDLILRQIIELIKNEEFDFIIEVGAGSGILTSELVKLNCKVISFEIDKSLKQYLDNIKDSNLDIIYEDFLNVDLKKIIKPTDNFAFIANIPYYITTPIINKFINSNLLPTKAVIMVQKELGKRLCASPKSSEYGAISVILNYFYKLSYEFDVDRKNFYPIPNVDSAIIMLKKREFQEHLLNFEFFKTLVYKAFSQKRKTLKNNLGEYNLEIISEILNKYKMTTNARAEELDYKIFIELANTLYKS